MPTRRGRRSRFARLRADIADSERRQRERDARFIKPIVKRDTPPISDPAFEAFLVWELEVLFPFEEMRNIFGRIQANDQKLVMNMFIRMTSAFMEAFLELLAHKFPDQPGRRALVEQIIKSRIGKMIRLGFPELDKHAPAP